MKRMKKKKKKDERNGKKRKTGNMLALINQVLEIKLSFHEIPFTILH